MEFKHVKLQVSNFPSAVWLAFPIFSIYLLCRSSLPFPSSSQNALAARRVFRILPLSFVVILKEEKLH